MATVDVVLTVRKTWAFAPLFYALLIWTLLVGSPLNFAYDRRCRAVMHFFACKRAAEIVLRHAVRFGVA